MEAIRFLPLKRLLCALIGHDARGPVEGCSYLDGDRWYPFYLCARCRSTLMWRREYPNGWKVNC